MTSLLQILLTILQLVQFIVIAHVIMSWLISFNVLNTRQQLVWQIWTGLERLLEPIYAPIRRVLPSLGGLDLAPLVVLLTPGPWNETYFEHTLLSRYLGFPLVEGGDLSVRDGRVWLKTIGGLKRVHRFSARWLDRIGDRDDPDVPAVHHYMDCGRAGCSQLFGGSVVLSARRDVGGVADCDLTSGDDSSHATARG